MKRSLIFLTLALSLTPVAPQAQIHQPRGCDPCTACGDCSATCESCLVIPNLTVDVNGSDPPTISEDRGIQEIFVSFGEASWVGTPDDVCNTDQECPAGSRCYVHANRGVRRCVQGLNHIHDASTIPETFVPGRTVTIRLVAEGAGYENAFGYYNVSDDISQRQNLHVLIPGCTVHPDWPDPHSDPMPYEPSCEIDCYHCDPDCGCSCDTGPGCQPDCGCDRDCGSCACDTVHNDFEVTIDFCAERAAGRWHGGPIGFFLATPEPSHLHPNCADPSWSEHIYYSESDLNIWDGESYWIHLLIYKSSVHEDGWYFGFEDLFDLSGSDNDFEDMLVLVTGLGTTGGELCNNLDDDCDGEVDEDLERTCTASNGYGTCYGVERCSAGLWGGCSAPGPSFEDCNGLDDDCDGQIDEDLPAEPCERQNEHGLCQGIQLCGGTQGWVGCSASPPQPELCNGLDDDCDGAIDEDMEPRPCFIENPLGACPGAQTCLPGGRWSECQGREPGVETCNMLDDDCDGQVDESAEPEVCESANEHGVCSGFRFCDGGVYGECNAPLARPEECNGLDDDCDGAVDEDIKPRPCSRESEFGYCDGVETCAGQAGWLGCTARLPSEELCNGLDDDCDGQADEGMAPRPCYSSNAHGTCPGLETCRGGEGWMGCDAAEPGPEVCNGLDDDCDGQIDDSVAFRPCEVTNEHGTCASVEPCLGEEGYGACQARTPAEEECNGLDDDCDGDVDEGCLCTEGDKQACYSGSPETDGMGVCRPGVQTCHNYHWGECEGEVLPVPEECDNLDNDCNGLIDDGDLSRDCFTLCAEGREVCRRGHWVECTAQQPRDEVCDGVDNDCDGLIDGEGLCPEGMRCLDGQCVAACLYHECPFGFSCTPDDWCVPRCSFVSCPGDTTCIDGECVQGTCYDVGCSTGRVCRDGACVPDPCAVMTCGPWDLCLDGECIQSCAGILCAEGWHCVKGWCEEDPCFAVVCLADQVCSWGDCLPDRCMTVECPPGQVCRQGQCEDDPCIRVHCPQGQVCSEGTCHWQGSGEPDGGPGPEDASLPTMDASVSPAPDGGGESYVCTGGSGDEGCSLAPGPTSWGGHIIILLLLGLPLLVNDRRRARGRRHGRCPIFLILILLLTQSCGDATPPVCHWQASDAAQAIDTAPPPPLPDLLWGHDRPTGLGDCLFTNFAVEICDGVDNDCDGQIDEELTQPCSTPCGEGTEACSLGEWQGCDAPPALEEVCDGVDNDCDGEADEGILGCCVPGRVEACSRNVGVCAEGTHTCLAEGVWGDCSGVMPDEESCDGLDNDCDGEADEGLARACMNDCGQGIEMCSQGEWQGCTAIQPSEEICDGVDNDCNGQVDEGLLSRPCTISNTFGRCEGQEVCGGFQGWVGCSARAPTEEICDGVDNDCDGEADEGLTVRSCYRVSEEGVCQGVESCDGEGGWVGCTASEPVPETCNGNDDNCNGVVDEGIEPQSCQEENEFGLCQGLQYCVAGLWTDCNASVPGPEECDGLDNDCSGLADDGLAALPCEEDFGGGQICRGERVCLGASGWSGCNAGPPEAERCNGLDDDCDGEMDEDVFPRACLRDSPFGSCEGTQRCLEGRWEPCVAPEPLAEECNGEDDNCNGQADEGLSVRACSVENEYGSCDGVQRCRGAEGWTACDASDPALEVCNGLDDDCNGEVDDLEDPFLNMVLINGSYYIDRYEASRPDATAEGRGYISDRTCVRGGVMPWSNVSYEEAREACERSGKRLCTAEEWSRACGGVQSRAFPYGAAYQPQVCNGAHMDGDPGTPEVDHETLPTGSLPLCRSVEGVYDLSGNVWEITATMSDNGWVSIRGGSAADFERTLSCGYQSSWILPDSAQPFVGFRCCRDGW